MSKIQIICSKPGIRRNGIENPASAIYEKDRWTDKELDAFRADPAFMVLDANSASTAFSGPEFDAAVNAKVETAKVELEKAFNKTLSETLTEKLAEATAKHDNAMDALGKKLSTAEAKVKELEAAAKADAKKIAELSKPSENGTK